ncbi:Helix-turn-helix transcriptional regulator, partial [Dysosmobacter welbionis]
SGKHTEQYGGKGLRSLSSVCINKIRSSLSRNILNCRIAAFAEMEEGGNASHFNTALLKHSIPLPD